MVTLRPIVDTQASLPTSANASNPRTLRQQNARLVLAQIRRHKTLTRSDLTRATGLAKSTIKEITDQLVTSAIIEEVRDVRLDGRVGRPASSLRISPSSGYVVGVDIGAEKVLAGVAGLDGHLIALERKVTHDIRGKAAILEATRDSVRSAMSRAGADPARVLVTLVGTPGVISPQTRRVTLAPQILGWDGTDLYEELALPVAGRIEVKRQADLSALAELATGAAREVTNLLYVHVGIGVGGALVIGGHLYGGNDGAAGEIGYLPIGFGETPPAVSGFGTFEWAAGGSAFARAGSKAALGAAGARLRELAGGDPDNVTAVSIFAAAAEGDRAGLMIATQMADRLATGIAAAVCVVNPELTVISGGISLAGNLLLEMVSERISQIVSVMPRLALSSLGEESVVLGAIQYGIDLALEQVLYDAPKGSGGAT
jgi:glucokinase